MDPLLEDKEDVVAKSEQPAETAVVQTVSKKSKSIKKKERPVKKVVKGKITSLASILETRDSDQKPLSQS